MNDSTTELDGLSDLDLEILQEAIAEEALAKDVVSAAIAEKLTAYAPAKPRVKASDDECETFVERILENYPKFVTASRHWSLTLISIIHKLGYRPASAIVANVASYAPLSCSDLRLVEKHVTSEILEEIELRVKAEYDPTSEAEKEIEINENFYMENKTDIEVKAASVEKEGWASW